MKLAGSFNRLVVDYSMYSSQVMIHHPVRFPHFHSWSPPPSGWVKVNVDAYVVSGAYRGLRAVIRNDKGVVLVAGVRKVVARWSVDICETTAAQFGVELALRFGYSYVNLEGDSMNIMSVIESNVEGSSPIHHIFDCIFYLSSSFFGFGCSFVRRNANTLGHLVARWDTGLANEKDLYRTFPQRSFNLG